MNGRALTLSAQGQLCKAEYWVNNKLHAGRRFDVSIQAYGLDPRQLYAENLAEMAEHELEITRDEHNCLAFSIDAVPPTFRVSTVRAYVTHLIFDTYGDATILHQLVEHDKSSFDLTFVFQVGKIELT